MTTWSDGRLVQACLDGDEAAWAALIERYKHLIYSAPFKYRATPDDAADIFQAVCLELYTSLPRLKHMESLRAWIITVTSHQCFQWRRRQQHCVLNGENPLEEMVASAPGPTASEMQEALEREQAVRDAVRPLPARCQRMVRLLFAEEHPSPDRELAARLGLATGSIGLVRDRCLKKLLQYLDVFGRNL